MAGLLLACFITLFMAVPEAQAQCGSPGVADAYISYEGCTEAKSGGSNVTSLSPAVPAGTVSGDLLITSISVDGSHVINTPAGWTAIDNNVVGAGAVTLGVFYRVADGTEPGSYSFSWTGGERAISIMMRFSNATGNFVFATNTGSTGAPQAPSVNTTGNTEDENNLILRLAAWDDDDQPNNPAVIIPGHTNINQDQGSGGAASASGAAAFVQQPAAGASGTADFAVGSEQWATMTVALEPNPPVALPFYCPGTDGAIGVGQLVVLEQCTQFLGGTNAVQITIDKPALAQEGDLMIAVINTDGNELPLATAPTADGFTLVREDEGDGITFAIYSKFVGTGEPANYTWNLSSNERRIAYIVLFTGASGRIIPDPVIPFNEGTSASPLIPAITTAVANTLVLRLSTNDHSDVVINPAEILPGGTPAFTNITSVYSDTAAGAVSAQGVYRNAATAALYGTENFSLTANEYWKAITLGVEPLQFKFSFPDANTQMSLCAIEQVTLRVTNSADQPVVGFSGTVSLSTSGVAGGVGDWADPAALGNFGTLTPGPANSGTATYDFSPLDGGEITLEFTTGTIGALSFDLDYLGRFSESPGADDPTLIVDDNCEFAIDFDNNTAGTCSSGPQGFTLQILDSAGDVALNYTGTVNLTLDSGTGGDYTTGGVNPIVQGALDDGAADYTFALADLGSVTFNYVYTSITPQTINIDATDVSPPVAVSYDTGAIDESLVISDCEVRISYVGGDDTRDVCSIAQVIFTITDSAGGVVTGYDGDLDITTDSLTGDWSGTVPGVLDNTVNGTGNGEANYDFSGAEAGVVTLDFRNPFINPLITFAVSGTATNTATVVLSADISSDPTLEIAGCDLTIDVASATNQSDVCRAGEIVTYTIFDRDGAVATDFNGLVVLQTDGLPAIGDYSLPNPPSALVGGFGIFDNGGGNDGIATYEFDPVAGDAGVLEVLFTSTTVDTVLLDANVPGITTDNSDGTIEFEPCEFRIEFIDATPNVTDVCSIEVIRISLFDIDDDAVTDYTGSITLSTSSGDGTWSVNSATNVITDPVAEDGSASYEFDLADLGTIDLNFAHAASNQASVNIDVTDNITTDPGNPGTIYDGNLAVELCTFTISYDNGVTFNDLNASACGIHQVTISVLDRTGSPPTPNYTGTIDITTTTNHGDWGIGDGQGTLNPNPDNDDNGAVTYTFDSTDGNNVVLDFANLNTETLSVDIVDQVEGIDGVMVEDGAADPDLTVTSCFPVVSAQSCVNATSTSITVDTGLPLASRMMLMVVNHEGTTDVDDFPTFGGNDMTLIYQEKNLAGLGNTMEMWGILDADFPAGPGPHVGSFTGPGNGPSMCLLYITDVEQNLALSSGTDNDPVNGSQDVNNAIASTTVTTTANNAIVISVVGNGSGGNVYDLVSPNPPMSRLFQGPDPNSGDFAGSSGVLSSAAAVTIDETWDEGSGNNPNRHTHIVASFAPFITGPPIAVGYVPVELFQTYSGNISYRAFGASLRTNNNSGGSCNANDFASASLTLPDEVSPPGLVGPDSTVIAAWLYWFGSGDLSAIDPGSVFDEVTLVDPSLTSTVITGEDLFIVENVGNADDKNYFASYKDVTALVTGNGTYTVEDLDADFGAPWSNTGACAGGWSMIVIYENLFEQLRVINLFHGFQPFQDSAFTLIPRNFRMAAPDLIGEVPNGQVTHVTVEGDETIFSGDEGLRIQDVPGGTDPALFPLLLSDYNPALAEFNGTITRPIYELVDLDPGLGEDFVYQFNPLAGANGYEIDFQGPDLPPTVAGDEPGASWGVDIDTHYISGDGDAGDGDSDVLNPFAAVGAEEITTRYSSGGDLVLLVSEVISVTNAPIADLEVFKTEVGDFKVNTSNSSYEFEVTNNGNGAVSFGEATGKVFLSDVLPPGMTFAAPGDVSGTGWDCSIEGSVQLDPGAFTCVYDVLPGELDEDLPGNPGFGKSLPILTANVVIDGPPTFFPSLNNDAKNVVRMLHADGTCVDLPGVSPDPAGIGCNQSPEFDNVNDLQGGAIDINTIFNKTGNNNNVDSITTNVKGVETDLGIEKFANGVLEEDEPDAPGQYTLAVTNFGPDDITPSLVLPTITVTDIEPDFVEFTTVDVTTDPDWNCNIVDGSPDTLTCTFDGTLLVGNTTNIILNVDVTGSDGDIVTNTTAVDSGLYNFDINGSNDDDTDITPIVSTPAASSEKFLLSVSSTLGITTIGTGGGELADFENDDLIIFDPVLDEAEMFLDNSDLGYGLDDINAVHLQPNGHVVLSANGPSTMGDNVLAFDKDDLVIYDPITEQASLFFDGSIISPELPAVDVNIDSVYVLNNGDIVFSTTESASIGGTIWLDSDLVLWDGATASIYLEGADADVFGASTVQLDASYVRADPADATAVIDTFVFSADNEGATAGNNNGIFGRDDVLELIVDDRTNPNVTSSENLFKGNLPIGLFTGVDIQRRINALHVLEDGFMGHFAISEAQSGTACLAGKITITKHLGVSHDIDTGYAGAIRITNSINEGIWSIDTGNGTLVNFGLGEALYTFVPSDNGQVTLNLDVSEEPPAAKSFNVDVTNHIVQELGTEDPNFNYNLVITPVTYRDEFSLNAFDNNDGSTGWAADWVEVDDESAGAATGNVSVSGGALHLTSTPATTNNPSLTRAADLSLYNVTETVFLNFDYSYSDLSAADEITVFARDGSGGGFIAVTTYTGLSGNSGAIAESLDLTTALAVADFSVAPAEIRFEITNGYTLNSIFTVDNVELATGTTDCGIGQIDHFDIEVASSGIACVASTVTIIGHDANHFPAAPGNGTVINLSTSTGAGTWASVLTGSPSNLTDVVLPEGLATNVDGQGSYTFFGEEESIQLQFNYTDPATDGALVDIDIGGVYSEQQVPDHDPSITFAEIGLLFFDDVDPGGSTTLPFQIAGKPSATLPSSGNVTLQMIRSIPIPGDGFGAGNSSLACESLLPDQSTARIKLAAVCENPGTCAAPTMTVVDAAATPQATVPVFNSGTLNPAASGLEMDLFFENQPTVVDNRNNIGSSLNFTYPDVGKISLHAEFDVPFDNDIAGVRSGDRINGASEIFNVRPFGFDVDFSNDRAGGGSGSFAADATGPPFARAGVDFSATISAVAWEQADDLNEDGVPDIGTDLSNNSVTANYGQENAGAGAGGVVLLSVSSASPGVPGGVNGTVIAGKEIFDGFANGSKTQTIAIDEVGIFDLEAVLVDNNLDKNPINYFDEPNSEGVFGGVSRVGRIYPSHFEMASGMLMPRVNQSMVCANSSSFTYMGEDFGLDMVIEAKNGLGNTTVNYRDDFANLTAFGELNIRAIIDEVAAADIDLGASARLVNTNLSVPAWVAGSLTINGDMNIARPAGGAPEPPLTGVQIAFGPIDDNNDEGLGPGPGDDVLLDVLDVDLDDGITEPGDDIYRLIGTHEYRYGRLLVDNAYGPETEPLGIPLRLEYYSDTRFLTNTEDSCTALVFDLASPALSYIPTSYEAPLVDGDTEIEQGAPGDVTVTVYQGQTNRLADGDNDDENDPDRPFITSAPLLEHTGRVMVEFDLSDLLGESLPTRLDFLRYDWRGDAGEVNDYDEIPDGDYTDNPRGVVEFGSYRGHDRVINWQEISTVSGP